MSIGYISLSYLLGFLTTSITSLNVYTKKQSKVVYNLATFSEPLSRQATSNLPAHVIEEPAAEGDLEENNGNPSYRE